MFGRQDNTNTSGFNDTSNQDSSINDLVNDLNQSSDTNLQPPQPPSPRVPFMPIPTPPHEDSLPDPVTDQPDHLLEPTDNDSSTPSSSLVGLKAQALDQLYPIVHTLKLSPEEHFKLLMSMIHVTDNQELLSEAYETAQKIEDETVKAQALLDIVNEINYFTNSPSVK